MSELKVVLHVHQEENLNVAFKNINNLKALRDDAKCCLLITGPCIKAIVGDEKISTLLNKNVEVKACQNSIDHFEIDKSNIIDGVEVVPAGILSLIDLQNAGFAYIKP